MISPPTVRRVMRRGATARLPTPSRAAPPMSIVVRGYAIPLGKIGLGLLVAVAVGATHLSVHSLAAYKEGVKQGLRTEISRLQRANHERQEAVERTARAALEQYPWEGAVRLPVETLILYQADAPAHSTAPVSLSREHRSTDGERAAVEDGWYWRLARRLKQAMSRKGGKPGE